MKFIYNLVLVSTFLVLFYGIFSTVSTASACGDDDWPTRSPCPTRTPKPTPTPSPSPSVTPSPTPTPSPSVTPTPSLSPSPSPSPLPSSTPTPTPTPNEAPGGGQGGPGGGGGGAAGPVECVAADPGGVNLLSVLPKGSASVEVKWTKNLSAIHYAVSYGLTSGSYIYGLPNTGNTDTTLISGLNPGQRYCFAVTAINDCRPGILSNEICIGSVGQVLGLSFGGGEVLGLSSTSSEDEGTSGPAVDESLPDVKLLIEPADFVNPIKISSVPSQITIPALSIDLPVEEAKVENGFWQIFDEAASHGIGSANPGEGSNVVISAHNREGMFGNLKFAQVGNEITVLTKDGKYIYRVSEIKEVTPDQVETIAPTGEETLTLYTCTGENDEKRLVVVAKLVN